MKKIENIFTFIGIVGLFLFAMVAVFSIFTGKYLDTTAYIALALDVVCLCGLKVVSMYKTRKERELQKETKKDINTHIVLSDFAMIALPYMEEGEHSITAFVREQ